MIYVDANVFVYLSCYGEETPENISSLEKIGRLVREKQLLGTSTLTWDEVAWIATKNFGNEKAQEVSERLLFNIPRLTFLSVNLNTVHSAQEFFKQGIRPRDAIHAACALENKCKEILSDDADFDKIIGLKRIPI